MDDFKSKISKKVLDSLIMEDLWQSPRLKKLVEEEYPLAYYRITEPYREFGLYSFLKIAKEQKEFFKKAIDNVAPILEVKSKRIGGATYQVPIEISDSRRMALAMRWIINYAKARKGQTMSDRLAAELIAAANNDGSSVKKKEDTHRMAEANKAFSHFR